MPGDKVGQHIQMTGGHRTVTAVEVDLELASGSITVTLSSAIDGGGTVYASKSQAVSSTRGMYKFTFVSPTLISADFFITVSTAGGGYVGWYNAEGYGGSGYGRTVNGSEDTDKDLKFKVYTQ